NYNIFVNIDTEDYLHYNQTIRILDALLKEYKNVGTVIQTYFLHAQNDIEKYKDVRLRIVKGAYKERQEVAYQTKEDNDAKNQIEKYKDVRLRIVKGEYKESHEVAYQTKEEIDANFIKIVKERLLTEGGFTSIATHDHHIINEVKRFVEAENIDKSTFEFQMLYGFRVDMQEALAEEGYLFCTYVPFGHDWYGYFMRRLAERPQNMNLMIKDQLFTKDNKLKTTPKLIATAGITAIVTALLC